MGAPIGVDGIGARLAATVAEAALLVLLVVLPAAFNPAGVLAFEPLKASLLRCTAVLIGVLWLWGRLGGQDQSIDVGAHPVVRAGLALIGLAAVSTMFSIDPRLSFFGSFDRGMGWLSLAAGGVLLVTTADLFADEHRRERAVSALLWGSVIPCCYMVVQRVGVDPMHWASLGVPGSSFGSPTFLGGYIVLVAPFCPLPRRGARPAGGLACVRGLASAADGDLQRGAHDHHPRPAARSDRRCADLCGARPTR